MFPSPFFTRSNIAFPTSYFGIRGNRSRVLSEWMIITLLLSDENPLASLVMSLATTKSRFFAAIFFFGIYFNVLSFCSKTDFD